MPREGSILTISSRAVATYTSLPWSAEKYSLAQFLSKEWPPSIEGREAEEESIVYEMRK
jgi:hypothetical protein